MAEFRQVISEEDIAEVARLAQEIWQEHYIPIIGREQVDYMLEKFQSRGAITSQIAQKYEYYLVLDQGQSAGYVGVVPDTGELRLLLSKIYIQKELRGRGLGKEALGFVEELCRQRGFAAIRLTVNKNNARSLAWYQRMGFANIGPIVQDIGGGFVMDDFIMEKELPFPQSEENAEK
jgi:ribosomal protein S18 acetylase RimI-like enzyme